MENLKLFGKSFGLGILIFVAIIVNVAVFNAAVGTVLGGFEVWVALINLIVEVGALGYLFKKHVLK